MALKLSAASADIFSEVISIRENISELEREHRQRELLAECYSAALQNAADYAIEVEAAITEPYRKELSEFARRIPVSDISQVVESKPDLRSIFRNFRDQAVSHLNRLRADLSEAVTAFHTLVGALSAADGDHDSKLRKALSSLREAGRLLGSSPVRQIVIAAAENIEQSLEELHKQHQLTIAQFVTETRLLHTRIDELERSAAAGRMATLLHRAELEQRLLQHASPRTLLLVKAKELRACEKAYNTEVYAQVASAFAQRLRNGLPNGNLTGCWGDEQFLCLLPIAEEEAACFTKWAADYLSGSYVCRYSGKSVVPKLKISATLLRGLPNESGPELYDRISRRFESL
ncbi:MAG: hypothetical protein C5B51_28650 [Terriglobia bacterium]|nr:MAG: hypothetical protein C5B51_28650 [Terriglobia bacterium]